MMKQQPFEKRFKRSKLDQNQCQPLEKV